MIPGYEVVERVLALATADETIVIVTDASEASLRWAGNSMTTNGISTSRKWAVASIVRGSAGARVATASSTSIDPAEFESIVRKCEADAGEAEPAEPDKLASRSASTAVSAAKTE